MSLTRLVCGLLMLPKMLATLHSVTLLDMRTVFLNMTIYFCRVCALFDTMYTYVCMGTQRN